MVFGNNWNVYVASLSKTLQEFLNLQNFTEKLQIKKAAYNWLFGKKSYSEILKFLIYRISIEISFNNKNLCDWVLCLKISIKSKSVFSIFRISQNILKNIFPIHRFEGCFYLFNMNDSR